MEQELKPPQYMEYVDTINGRIPIMDLPLVSDESVASKFMKSGIFFIILLVIVVMFFLLTESNRRANIPNEMPQEIFLKDKVQTTIKASAINVYCSHEPIIIENIILNTVDRNADNGTMINMVNIDCIDNEFMVIDKKCNGLSYFINLGREYEVESIIIISDRYKYVDHVTIELYNGTGNTISMAEKTWEFKGPLLNRRDNLIPITKIREFYAKDYENTYFTKINRNEEYNTPLMYKKAKNVINEDNLQIQISEDGETYVGF
ncbi:MAG: hypothetical protein ACRCZI_02830 [Cetobacterium sp.]